VAPSNRPLSGMKKKGVVLVARNVLYQEHFTRPTDRGRATRDTFFMFILAKAQYANGDEEERWVPCGDYEAKLATGQALLNLSKTAKILGVRRQTLRVWLDDIAGELSWNVRTLSASDPGVRRAPSTNPNNPSARAPRTTRGVGTPNNVGVLVTIRNYNELVSFPEPGSNNLDCEAPNNLHNQRDRPDPTNKGSKRKGSQRRGSNERQFRASGRARRRTGTHREYLPKCQRVWSGEPREGDSQPDPEQIEFWTFDDAVPLLKSLPQGYEGWRALGRHQRKHCWGFAEGDSITHCLHEFFGTLQDHDGLERSEEDERQPTEGEENDDDPTTDG